MVFRLISGQGVCVCVVLVMATISADVGQVWDEKCDARHRIAKQQ